MKYDLAIAYRIYPGISKVPPVYSDDKLKLSELCLRSFRDALSGLRFKIYFILDNCPPDYDVMVKKYFDGDDVEFIHLEKTGNPGTFKMQMDILLNQNYSDNVYFAEDDYFYLPVAFSKMLEFLHSENKPDFISAFDHKDYYTSVLHDYSYNTIQVNNQMWRTGSSTCMTFLTRKDILHGSKKIFYSYAKKNYDNCLWITLTKTKIFSLPYHFKLMRRYHDYPKFLVKLLYFGWQQLIFGRKYTLYAPKPSLSTHMDSECLAPDIDWISEFEAIKK